MIPVSHALFLSLSRNDCHRIRTAVATAYPAEGCGLLAGVTEGTACWRVTRVVPTRNLLTQRDRFEVDPAARFALMRDVRGGSERLIGHYHSHPDGPACPSATDRAMAFEPELIWVIVAVANGRAETIKAYRLGGPTIHPVTIITPPERSRRFQGSHDEGATR
ncbi:MAG: Mov34/MPN/PAD-1 [Rhodospirillaceae bacterium]|nr:MAG: Mov34/MPN/PAD-1 [Rhodospirillaceae bacterium]